MWWVIYGFRHAMSEEQKRCPEPPPEELAAYQNLDLKDISRLVLCLLIGDESQKKLAALLPKAAGSAAS